VKWRGYPASANTWEPETNFVGSAALTILRTYQAANGIEILPPLPIPEGRRRGGDIIFQELMEAGHFPNGDWTLKLSWHTLKAPRA
jgi:hypothetical protein